MSSVQSTSYCSLHIRRLSHFFPFCRNTYEQYVPCYLIGVYPYIMYCTALCVPYIPVLYILYVLWTCLRTTICQIFRQYCTAVYCTVLYSGVQQSGVVLLCWKPYYSTPYCTHSRVLRTPSFWSMPVQCMQVLVPVTPTYSVCTYQRSSPSSVVTPTLYSPEYYGTQSSQIHKVKQVERSDSSDSFFFESGRYDGGPPYATKEPSMLTLQKLYLFLEPAQSRIFKLATHIQ